MPFAAAPVQAGLGNPGLAAPFDIRAAFGYNHGMNMLAIENRTKENR